jgi:hypothetical protein
MILKNCGIIRINAENMRDSGRLQKKAIRGKETDERKNIYKIYPMCFYPVIYGYACFSR